MERLWKKILHGHRFSHCPFSTSFFRGFSPRLRPQQQTFGQVVQFCPTQMKLSKGTWITRLALTVQSSKAGNDIEQNMARKTSCVPNVNHQSWRLTTYLQRNKLTDMDHSNTMHITTKVRKNTQGLLSQKKPSEHETWLAVCGRDWLEQSTRFYLGTGSTTLPLTIQEMEQVSLQ